MGCQKRTYLSLVMLLSFSSTWPYQAFNLFSLIFSCSGFKVVPFFSISFFHSYWWFIILLFLSFIHLLFSLLWFYWDLALDSSPFLSSSFIHFQGGFNLYCWKGIHFSWNNFLIFIFILFFGLIFSFHFWFRDLLRELNKKYEILLMVLFLVLFLFLASEGLLFVSFFWASFHSLSSPTLGSWPGEGFYLPDPCELTFANTLLLSNAAVSLGGAFVSLEISSQFIIFFSLFSFILAWTFI